MYRSRHWRLALNSTLPTARFHKVWCLQSSRLQICLQLLRVLCLPTTNSSSTLNSTRHQTILVTITLMFHLAADRGRHVWCENTIQRRSMENDSDEYISKQKKDKLRSSDLLHSVVVIISLLLIFIKIVPQVTNNGTNLTDWCIRMWQLHLRPNLWNTSYLSLFTHYQHIHHQKII